MPVGGGEAVEGGWGVGGGAVDVVCFGAGAALVCVGALAWCEGWVALGVRVAEPSVLTRIVEERCMPSGALAPLAALDVCAWAADACRAAARRGADACERA